MGWTNSSGWTSGAGGWNKAAAAGGSPVVYTYDFIASPSLPAELSLSRATSGTNFNTSGTMVTAAINAARFENVYNGSAWVKAGLLVESQKTNYVGNSSDFTTWTYTNTNSVAGSPVASLDGTSDAYPITPTTNNFYHRYYYAGGPTTGSMITDSIYLKPNGYSQFMFKEIATTGVAIGYNLSGSGSVLSPFNAGGHTITGAIKALSGSWYRPIGFLTPASSTLLYLGCFTSDGGYTSGTDPESYGYAGNATSGIINFGPQMEIGSFASSYIPTTGSPVTRSADLLSSNSPLTGYLAAGPSVWELTDLATGATTRTSFAAGAFTFPADKLYRSFGVYPSGTDTTPYLTVGGAY